MISAPKFDPNSPSEYYLKRCAGGPNSNKVKLKHHDPTKQDKAALMIQKQFKVYKALKVKKAKQIEQTMIKQEKDANNKLSKEVQVRNERKRVGGIQNKQTTCFSPTQYFRKVEAKRESNNKLSNESEHLLPDGFRLRLMSVSKADNESASMGSESISSRRPIETEQIIISQCNSKPKRRKLPTKKQEILIQASQKNNVVYIKK